MVSIICRRAPQGARGLKYCPRGGLLHYLRRAPQGARGLKCYEIENKWMPRWSRPARGAWVEIQETGEPDERQERRAPQGARGLK